MGWVWLLPTNKTFSVWLYSEVGERPAQGCIIFAKTFGQALIRRPQYHFLQSGTKHLTLTISQVHQALKHPVTATLLGE